MSRFHARALVATAASAAACLSFGLHTLPAFADAAVTAPAVAPLRGADEPDVIADRYVVVLKPTAAVSPAAATPVVDSAVDRAEDVGADVTHTYDAAVHGYSATMTDAELAQVRQDPAVAYVEADRRISIEGSRTAGSWGQDRIDQRSGTNGRIITSGDGTGVTVYVIDTGIRSTHQDFGGRVAAGYSAVSDGNGTEDCNGHGTHVAGTVGSATYGVAPGVTLVPVRVLDCNGSGSSSAVIAGIDWVTAHHAANSVANLSLGGSAFAALDSAVANSIASGVTYAVAAGNSTEDACNDSPARLPQALTVAASTQSDGVAGFSNFGSCVDLYAPGQYIVSTVNTSDTATASYSGTSMASPHVAGAAALYLQAHPGATPADVSAGLLGDATSGALTGVPSGTPNLLLYAGSATAAGGTTGGSGGGTGSGSGAGSGGGTSNGSAGSTTANPAPTTTPTPTPTPATPTTAPAKKPPTTPATTPKAKSGKAYCRGLHSQGAMSVASTVVARRTYTTHVRGTQYGCLTGPKKANFDLVLSRYDGKKWVKVARGKTATADESVAYTGRAGRYRWQVVLVQGSGSYNLQVAYPSA